MGMLSRNIAIDLGTANARLFVLGKGLVIDEPSVVAVESGRVVAAGTEARRMAGCAAVAVEHPLRNGAIADFGLAESMLRHFIARANRWGRVAPPRLAVAVPSGATDVERRAVMDVTYRAGARSVHLVEVPVAAALGCGLTIGDARAVLTVDIGAGTTDVAILSVGGVVLAHTARVGGNDVDRAIASYVRSEYAMLIGEQTDEQHTTDASGGVALTGRWKASGLPGAVALDAEEVARAAAEPITAIVATVRNVLEHCPPELSGDLMDRGIALTGGGALLHGLADVMREETRLPVQTADDPRSAVVIGTARHLGGLEAPKGTRRRARAALVFDGQDPETGSCVRRLDAGGG
ncbi:rod shape-determining protein [Actinomadura fulvescens]|uniref:Cell shape-determining protein MreB n=1 Tax=Actinomadura fulvescens TaxID=46160 RepID=A0ABP6C6Z0_9ACTN